MVCVLICAVSKGTKLAPCQTGGRAAALVSGWSHSSIVSVFSCRVSNGTKLNPCQTGGLSAAMVT